MSYSVKFTHMPAGAEIDGKPEAVLIVAGF